MSELVDFDLFFGGEWRDSGEGGQYVMLVVTQPETHRHNCYVDVSVELPYPDVCLTPNELWSAETGRDAEVLFAAHLGSSSRSMWNETRGYYWTATLDSLTAEGRQLYDLVARAYDTTPLLLTFLDT